MIEKITVKSFLDFSGPMQVEPMSNDTTRLMMSLYMSEMDASAKAPLDPFDRINIEKNRLGEVFGGMRENLRFNIWCARMHSETKATDEAILFLLSLCNTPGKIVLWCYTLHRLSQKTKALIKLGTLADHWPIGFPTEKAMGDCWEAQKGGALGLTCDNALDQSEHWLP